MKAFYEVEETGRIAQMDAPETVEVEVTQVSCDGGGGAAGHPKVFLVIGDAGFVECPYCDKRFTLKPGAKRSAAH